MLPARYFIGFGFHPEKKCHWLCLYDNRLREIFWPEIPDYLGWKIASIKEMHPAFSREDISLSLECVDLEFITFHDFYQLSEDMRIMEGVTAILKDKFAPPSLFHVDSGSPDADVRHRETYLQICRLA